jgi:hypothetical protein
VAFRHPALGCAEERGEVVVVTKLRAHDPHIVPALSPRDAAFVEGAGEIVGIVGRGKLEQHCVGCEKREVVHVEQRRRAATDAV